jgi:hypothetical protein
MGSKDEKINLHYGCNKIMYSRKENNTMECDVNIKDTVLHSIQRH